MSKKGIRSKASNHYIYCLVCGELPRGGSKNPLSIIRQEGFQLVKLRTASFTAAWSSRLVRLCGAIRRLAYSYSRRAPPLVLRRADLASEREGPPVRVAPKALHQNGTKDGLGCGSLNVPFPS